MKKSTGLQVIDIAAVQSRMLTIRNQQVLLDRDVASLYGLETKALNQAVKRNAEKSPDKSGLECDAVLRLENGSHGLVEIKTGGDSLIEKGVKTLNALAAKLDTTRMPPLARFSTSNAVWAGPAEPL